MRRLPIAGATVWLVSVAGLAAACSGSDPTTGATPFATAAPPTSEVAGTVTSAAATTIGTPPTTVATTARPPVATPPATAAAGSELYVWRIHCGIGTLGLIDDQWWRLADAGIEDWHLPPQWEELRHTETSHDDITVSITRVEDPPRILAEGNGLTLTYVPGDDPPLCD